MISSSWVAALISLGTSLATCAFFLGRLTGRMDRSEKEVKVLSKSMSVRIERIEREYVTVTVCDVHKQHICQLVAEIRAIMVGFDAKLDDMLLLKGRVTEYMDAGNRALKNGD